MRTHLLTGAGAGIGAELAKVLRSRGDELLLVARNERRAAELAERHPGSTALVVDLADPASLQQRLEAQGLPDRLHSLLHVAGVVELGGVEEMDVSAWRVTLDVNLVAVAELTRVCLPALRTARGHVVMVNSGSGLRANPGWSAYAASKHGLRALADALRAEEQAAGIRVTSVYPGRVATDMQARVHAHEGKDYDPSAWIAPESVVATVLAALDLPRDAEMTDVSVRPGP